jgi:hypothetical protein
VPGGVPETAVPVRLTVWGLPLALSLMLREALRVPAAVGVNVTLIVQLAPAATPLPQVFVCKKSEGSVPLKPTLGALSAAFPVLLRVTFCAALEVPTYC